MNAAQLERMVRVAESECRTVLAQPKDRWARQRLFDALTPIAESPFQADGPGSEQLEDLFVDARIWADIVRTRISNPAKARTSTSFLLAIEYPARVLLPMLTDLRAKLARLPVET